MSSHYHSDTTFAVDHQAQPSAPPPRLNLVRMLRQNLLLIVMITVLIGVPACAAVWFLTPLEYRVNGQLLFSANAPTILGERETGRNVDYEKWLTSQLDIIQGPTILQKVADNRSIQSLPEVAEAPGAYEYLASKVTAASKRNSEIVTISARMKDGASAQRVVKAVIDQYMTFATNTAAEMDTRILNELTDERQSIEAQLESQQAEIATLSQTLEIPVANGPQLGPSEMDSARAAYTSAIEALQSAETKIETIERQLELLASLRSKYDANPGAQLWELGIEDSVGSDPGVATLRNQLVNAEASLQQLRETMRESLPQRQVAEKNFATLQREVAKKEAQVRREKLDSAKARYEGELERANGEKADAESKKETFKAQLDEFDRKLAGSASAAFELTELQAKAETNRDRLKTIRDRIDKLQLEKKAPARIQPLADPVVPQSPDFGRRYQLMGMSLLAALATGLGVALLRELLNKQARTAQDLATITPLPVMASIPHTSVAKLPKNVHAEMLVADYPTTPISEEFRRLVARIVYPSDETIEINTCLVASPTRGDGKTTMACNLAVALAQANRRVLLIDICSRNPQIEAHFGLDADEGLAEILFENIPYQSLIRTTEFPDLCVLGPGLRTERLPGKLASREMAALLEELERDFDHVIIDTPPSLLISDAKLLAPIVDAVVLTVGVGRSTLGMVRRALTEFDQYDANVVGVVLNGIKHTRGGYMAKNFALYDKYASDFGGHLEEPIPEMKIADEDEPAEPAVVLIASDASEELVSKEDQT